MPRLDLTAEARDAHLDLSSALASLTPADLGAVIATWRGRMLNEHISARVFAGIIGQMMAAGVSASKQEAVAGMICDELRHGRMCAAVVYALGGEPVVDLPPLPPVPQHEDASPLEGLLRNVLSISCLSETVAVSLISAERLSAGHPTLDATLASILADEVQHARFGWALLEEVRPQIDAPLRARLGDYLVTAFDALCAHELTHLPALAAPSPAAEAAGACDGLAARSLFFQTVEQVIIPRLEELGLPAQAAWASSIHGLAAASEPSAFIAGAS